MEGGEFDQELTAIMNDCSEGAAAFAPLASLFAAGVSPDVARAREVGEDMRSSGQRLKAVLDNMENSDDFQAIENYYSVEASARHLGIPSARTLEQMVNWQADGLLAFTEGRPMSPPPEGVQKAAEVAPGQMDPQLSALPPERLWPFTEESFGSSEASQQVLADFGRLVRDHKQLVGLGENYGTFDARGKLFYLDELAKIVARWEGLLAAARQAGVSPDYAYSQNSEAYLRRSSFSAEGYRDSVLGIHQSMRESAAREEWTGR